MKSNCGLFLYIFWDVEGLDGIDWSSKPDSRLPVKIGVTKDPHKRLADLRRKYSDEGTWCDIRYLEHHGVLLETLLKEVFSRWKPFLDDQELFLVSYKQMIWLCRFFELSEAFMDLLDSRCFKPGKIQKWMLESLYYFHPDSWLKDRLAEMFIEVETVG